MKLKQAIQAAISSAFPSSALKESKKDKGDLRSRLTAIDKDFKNGRIAQNETLLLKVSPKEFKVKFVC